jgi:hypothetical protein
MSEQPKPTPGREDVTEALIAHLRERQAKGRATYGRSLETFNGRDAGRDALEEALDLAQYLMQMRLEGAALRAAMRAAREQVHAGAYTQAVVTLSGALGDRAEEKCQHGGERPLVWGECWLCRRKP